MIVRILFFVFALQPLAAQAELTAEVDTREMTNEQSLRLIVTSTLPNNNDQPDFSELGKDFELLGRSEQTNLQTIGQTMTQTRSWHLELTAKRVGPATIPAFSIGGEVSESIAITVLPAKIRKPGESKGDYYLEASVDQSSVYVQSQVIYTLRIFSVQNFLDGGLSEVEAEGAQVQELGDSRNYREEINGKPYQVLEKKYVLFPQRSGEIVVPPVLLDASVPKDGVRNRGIFTPSQKVRRRSESVVVMVKPRPDNSGSDWWLPASDVQLVGNWEGDVSALRVGDSVTRNIALQADGVSSTQLPQLPVPKNKNFKAYASEPQLDDQISGDGLRAVRLEKWAVVALQPGTVTLPEIKVPWFNTRTGQSEVAILPAETFSVLPSESEENSGNSGQNSNGGGNKSSGETDAEIAMLSASVDTMAAELSRWKWITLALSTALLMSVLGALAAWFGRGRHGKLPVKRLKPSDPPSLTAVEKACQSGSPRVSADALLEWARRYWPTNPPRTLVALAGRFESAELTNALSELDSALYAKDTDAPDVLASLATHFSHAVGQLSVTGETIQNSALPKL